MISRTVHVTLNLIVQFTCPEDEAEAQHRSEDIAEVLLARLPTHEIYRPNARKNKDTHRLPGRPVITSKSVVQMLRRAE